MTGPFETIRVEALDRGVTRLTLARAEKRNAMNARMIAELESAAQHLEEDPAVRVVILAAEGRSFCAGGDLDWMRSQAERSRAEREREAGALARMLDRLDRLPKLVIGDVRGGAYGGGLGLVSLCDIALATPEVRFALTEVKLGLIPATISPFVIRRIGAPHARRCMLNARPFDALEALRIGLLSAVVPGTEMDAAIAREVDLALACKPGAVGDSKALIRRLAVGETLGPADTAALLADRWETEEAKAGIAAFFSKSAS